MDNQMSLIARKCIVDNRNHLFFMDKEFIFTQLFVVPPCINANRACKPQAHCCFEAPVFAHIPHTVLRLTHAVDLNLVTAIICVITVTSVWSAFVSLCACARVCVWFCYRHKGLWSPARNGLHPRRLLHGGHREHDGWQCPRQLWECCGCHAQLQDWDIR